jgi:transcriptional regulator with XRE-family HTH domain
MKDTDNLKFGKTNKDYPEINKIRMLREGIGYSQDYVAKKMNITQQAYSKLEKNPNNATLERLRQLSEVLGVSVNSIVGDDEMYIQQNFHQQGGNAATVMHITGLADRERTALLQQIESLQKQVEVLTKIIDTKL